MGGGWVGGVGWGGVDGRGWVARFAGGGGCGWMQGHIVLTRASPRKHATLTEEA